MNLGDRGRATFTNPRNEGTAAIVVFDRPIVWMDETHVELHCDGYIVKLDRTVITLLNV